MPPASGTTPSQAIPRRQPGPPTATRPTEPQEHSGRYRLRQLPSIHFASWLQNPLRLVIMLGKYTVRIDTNKQVRDLFRHDLDETVGGIRRNDNHIPWADSPSRTSSNHLADRTWPDHGTHNRIVRWKLSRTFNGPAGDQDSASLEHVINLGNVVVQNSVRRAFPFTLTRRTTETPTLYSPSIGTTRSTSSATAPVAAGASTAPISALETNVAVALE